MPQHKKQIPVVGLYPALRADLIQFIKRRRPTFHGYEWQLEEMCMWAIQPKTCAELNITNPLADYYVSNPDLTLAVLTFIRKLWFGKHSRSRRIQNFLATTTGFRVFRDQREKWQWSMTDGEIATGFELATGEAVTMEDVIKARKALAARIKRGQKLGPPMQWVKGGKTLKKPSV
jgi:hypothetical protein